MLGEFSGFFVILIPAIILMAIGTLNVMYIVNKNNK